MPHTLKKIQKQKYAMRAMTSIPTEDYDQFRKLEKHYEGLNLKLDDLDAEADAAFCRTAAVVFITVAGSSIHRKILTLLKPKISELIIFLQYRNQIFRFSSFFFRRSLWIFLTVPGSRKIMERDFVEANIINTILPFSV